MRFLASLMTVKESSYRWTIKQQQTNKIDYFDRAARVGLNVLQHILVITDHFTRHTVMTLTKNQTVMTTAEAFLNNLIMHYGMLQQIHSDWGSIFQVRLIKELC